MPLPVCLKPSCRGVQVLDLSGQSHSRDVFHDATGVSQGWLDVEVTEGADSASSTSPTSRLHCTSRGPACAVAAFLQAVLCHFPATPRS